DQGGPLSRIAHSTISGKGFIEPKDQRPNVGLGKSHVKDHGDPTRYQQRKDPGTRLEELALRAEKCCRDTKKSEQEEDDKDDGPEWHEFLHGGKPAHVLGP